MTTTPGLPALADTIHDALLHAQQEVETHGRAFEAAIASQLHRLWLDVTQQAHVDGELVAQDASQDLSQLHASAPASSEATPAEPAPDQPTGATGSE